jgi:hypothetical protein
MKNRSNLLRSHILVFWGLSVIIALGGFLRLYPPLAAGFPINDGGMFVAMIEDLQTSNYALPYYTSYNYADIPYAYPPLAFYLGVLLVNGLGISVIRVLQLLPPIAAILTIPAYYWLCKVFLDNQAQAMSASFAFAVLPPMLDWLIMGAGITRSLGLIFALLALGSLVRLYHLPRWRYLAAAMVFCVLVILTHPIMAWFTAWSAALLFLTYGRNRQGVLNSALVVMGVAVFSAPWWLTILQRHGLETFIAAFGRNTSGMIGLSVLLLTIFANTPLLDVLSVIGLLGIFLVLRRRKYFLVAWLLLVLLIQRRFVNMMMIVPFGMLVAIGLDQLVLPGLNSEQRSATNNTTGENAGKPAATRLSYLQSAFLAYIVIVSVISGFLASAKGSLLEAQADSMTWARDHTPPSSQFAVLSGETFEGTDLQAEWFPALSHRRSINTVQGTEWLPSGDFYRQQHINGELQVCYDQDVSCVEEWAVRNKLQMDYLYLDVRNMQRVAPLLASLAASQAYNPVFENSSVKIYRYKSDILSRSL